MSDSMRDYVIVIVKLVLISSVAAALLGITYIPTQAQMKINQEIARNEGMKEIMPLADSFETVYGEKVIDDEGNKEVLYYRALDSSGSVVGYVFFRTEPGSQGPIDLAGGVDASFTTLTGMKVMGHGETPGMGAKIVEPAFRDQFNNVAIADLQLSNKGGKIDAISGATISSKAVISGLNGQIEELKSMV
ncbi:MAG: RnfABCDGE type electron transport complex subunit G [Methanosarcinaceae archaeon]|nr:RnfABCDGE type electron transport complex subunit G [Methanosarcinaceae archaeon]